MTQSFYTKFLSSKWNKQVLASLFLAFSIFSLHAQCTGTAIALKWGSGTTYNYTYHSVINGKCAYQSLSPGTSIAWTGTQWNVYASSSFSGTVFFHSTVDIGDRPSGKNSDWISDRGVLLISFTGTGVLTTAPPTVTTQAVTDITTSTATGNGNITNFGTDTPTAYGVCWNTGGTPTVADSKVDLGAPSATGSFTASMTGLTANTTYKVRAFATSSAGTNYGSEVSFTTPGISPTVSTQAASDIAATSATGNGNISDLGSDNPTAHGVCWNTVGTPTIADSKVDLGAASATGAFTASISGLTANTTYKVRAFATNSVGTSYGEEVSFTTLGIAPTVSTQAASDIAATSATGNGNISDLGTDNPTAHGVCWNTGGAPTISDNKTDLGATSAIGAFTASLSGLTANTTYKVRAFATNSAGTSYGEEVSFTTLGLAPTVSTSAVTDIIDVAATGNGNITDLGTDNPMAYGVCWNVEGMPTISDSKIDLGAAIATGAFTASITGLIENTTYKLRAFATNLVGTSYGEEVSFTTTQATSLEQTRSKLSVYSTGGNKIGLKGSSNAIIDVYNSVGLRIFSGTVEHGIVNRNFNKGVYLVVVKTVDKTSKFKIVIN